MADDDMGGMEAYVAQLLPVQQQAIATAQLAGCRFERRTYERDVRSATPKLSRDGYQYRPATWIETTRYEVFLPDGTGAGIAEDIYECALIALSILNTPPAEERLIASRLRPSPEEMFQLRSDNEPPNQRS